MRDKICPGVRNKALGVPLVKSDASKSETEIEEISCFSVISFSCLGKKITGLTTFNHIHI